MEQNPFSALEVLVSTEADLYTEQFPSSLTDQRGWNFFEKFLVVCFFDNFISSAS